eukprot:g31997.t1
MSFYGISMLELHNICICVGLCRFLKTMVLRRFRSQHFAPSICYVADALVTWGDQDYGGNSLLVEDQLVGVIAVYATRYTFAAIKLDGIVSWGLITSNMEQLTNVDTIYSTRQAFAAKKTDSTVVTWGNSRYGGDSSSVADQLTNVDTIYSNDDDFVAKKTVVTWGLGRWADSSADLLTKLTNVETIYSTDDAWAAKKTDGTVVTWGNLFYGGDSSSVADQLTNVDTIYSTDYAFAAKKTDGTVVTWGNSAYGGDSSSVADQLTNVDTIYSNDDAFAAKKTEGTVVTWGNSENGGDSSSVADQLTNETDGTVVTWGDSVYGGDSSSVADQLTNVDTIYSTGFAFAAKKTDGTVVTWGSSDYGGDSSSVADQLQGVATIYSTDYAFAAMTACSDAIDISGGCYKCTNNTCIAAVCKPGYSFDPLAAEATVCQDCAKLFPSSASVETCTSCDTSTCKTGLCRAGFHSFVPGAQLFCFPCDTYAFDDSVASCTTCDDVSCSAGCCDGEGGMRMALACNVYISEGRHSAVLDVLRHAAHSHKARAVHVHVDPTYHRTGFTFVSASPADLRVCLLALCTAAFKELDLRQHKASHPRLGVVDHICVSPLPSATVSGLAAAGALARQVSVDLGRLLPVVLYGEAACTCQTAHLSPAPTASAAAAAAAQAASPSFPASALTTTQTQTDPLKPAEPSRQGLTVLNSPTQSLAHAADYSPAQPHSPQQDSSSSSTQQPTEILSSSPIAHPPQARSFSPSTYQGELSRPLRSPPQDRSNRSSSPSAQPGGLRQHGQGCPAARADRSLAAVRRRLGYFQGAKHGVWSGCPPQLCQPNSHHGWDFAPEEAAVNPRLGVMTVGACPWVTNYNMLLSTHDLAQARQWAKQVSSRGPVATALSAVQTMALPHTEGVEIACNLLDADQTSPAHVRQAVASLARQAGVEIKQEYVIGKTVSQLLACLQQQESEA